MSSKLSDSICEQLKTYCANASSNPNFPKDWVSEVQEFFVWVENRIRSRCRNVDDYFKQELPSMMLADFEKRLPELLRKLNCKGGWRTYFRVNIDRYCYLTATTNLANSKARRSEKDVEEQSEKAPPSAVEQTEEVQQINETVRQCLFEMQPRYRKALLMGWGSNSNKEAAEAIRVDAGHMARSRKQAREMLEACYKRKRGAINK